MNEEEPAWRVLFRWGLRLAAWGFFAIAGVCFLLVALMAWRGDVWNILIYAERPVPHFLGGVGALFAWYVLLYGLHNTRRQWKSVAGRAALLTFSLAASLGAAETALRAWSSAQQRQAGSLDQLKDAKRDGKPPPVVSTHPLATIIQPSGNPKVVYELQPNLDLLFGNRRTRTNAQGMRMSRDCAPARTPGSVRIVGLGDSGMFGWGVEQDEEYMAVLETNLNVRRDGTLYEVLNMAVPGYNTQLEVETLRHKGLPYKPDIVVVGWCDNDFSLPFFLLEKEDYRRKDKSFLHDALFKRARQNTGAPRGFRLRDLREYDKTRVAPELNKGTDIEGVRTALTQLKTMGEENGFKVILFGPLHHQIRELCAEVGIPMANTLDTIPADKYPKNYLLYFMHPSKDGHRVLAEYLERDLESRGWLIPKGIEE